MPTLFLKQFTESLTQYYRDTVPHFNAMYQIVASVNAACSKQDPAHFPPLDNHISHTALRITHAREAKQLAQLFTHLFGMEARGAYDLSEELGVISTAFYHPDYPFRIFVSLLTEEVFEGLPKTLQQHLSKCSILTKEAEALLAQLVEQPEQLEKIGPKLTQAFCTSVQLPRDPINLDIYEQAGTISKILQQMSIGTQANHCTLVTYDIDTAHRMMNEQGLNPMPEIQGPDELMIDGKAYPVLLRQTSYKAIPFELDAIDSNETKYRITHQELFGEIETRKDLNLNLTPKGRTYLEEEKPLPNNLEQLVEEELIYAKKHNGTITLITYQDFLPKSAAGIFKSNLGTYDTPSKSEIREADEALRKKLSKAFGTEILDLDGYYTSRT